jgi:hypothetical protein
MTLNYLLNSFFDASYFEKLFVLLVITVVPIYLFRFIKNFGKKKEVKKMEELKVDEKTVFKLIFTELNVFHEEEKSTNCPFRQNAGIKQERKKEKVFPTAKVEGNKIIISELYGAAESALKQYWLGFEQLLIRKKVIEADDSIGGLVPLGFPGEFAVEINKRIVSFLDSGILLDKYNEYKEIYIAKLLNLRKKEKESWFFGEAVDSKKEIYLPCISKPAILCSGAMGSGKTTTVRSLLLHRFNTDPNIIFYAFDGKDSADWNSLADKLSTFKRCGVVDKGGDELVEFSNIIEKVWEEYMRRKKLFAKVDAINIESYRAKTGEDISYVIMLLEEFPVALNFLDFNKTEGIIGSTANKLKRLMKESRSFGINSILITQDVQDVPKTIAKNCVSLIHRGNKTVANYYQLDAIETLKPGQAFLKGDTTTLVSNFYLGDDIEPYLDNFKQSAKEKLDYALTLYTGNEKTPLSNWKLILSGLLNKEEWEVEDYISNPILKDIAFHANKNGIKICGSWLTKSNFNPYYIADKVDIARTHLYFCDFDLSAGETKKILEDKDGEWPGNAVFINKSELAKWFTRSFSDEFEGDVLYAFLKEKNEKFQVQQTKDLDRAKKEEELRKGDIKVELTPEFVDILSSMPAGKDEEKTRKGDALEVFAVELLSKYYPNKFCYTADYIIELGLSDSRFHATADGGLDLVVTDSKVTNKKEDLTKVKEVVWIQAKNYAGKVGVKPVGEILRAANNYKKFFPNLQEHEKWIICTTGYGKEAQQDAENNDIKLIGRKELVQIINIVNSKNDSPQTTQAPLAEVALEVPTAPVELSKKDKCIVLIKEGMSGADIARKLETTPQYVSRVKASLKKKGKK